ncbi:MAG: pyridoxamine 5'-phosphate oxidase family protein [Ilumatobacteraceae bacterium]
MGAESYELATWESMDLLQERSVGRLCVIEQGYPLAVPINYRFSDAGGGVRVVVRTAAHTMVGRYEGPASLEVDDIEIDAGTAWSVIARGMLRRVSGTHDLPDPDPLVTEGRHLWVTLDVSAVSGRRFAVHPTDGGFSVDWQLAID